LAVLSSNARRVSYFNRRAALDLNSRGGRPHVVQGNDDMDFDKI
jgi:hypothetical protein